MHNVWNKVLVSCVHVFLIRDLRKRTTSTLLILAWEGWPCRATSPSTISAPNHYIGSLSLCAILLAGEPTAFSQVSMKLCDVIVAMDDRSKRTSSKR